MDTTKMTVCFEGEHYKFYYLNGEPHREDGPAIETDIQQCWFINGKRHREDGPAVIKLGGQRGWFLNDEEVSWQEVYHNAKTAEQKVNILIHASADPSNLDDIIALTTP
jgi:hypothetical protein